MVCWSGGSGSFPFFGVPLSQKQTTGNRIYAVSHISLVSFLDDWVIHSRCFFVIPRELNQPWYLAWNGNEIHRVAARKSSPLWASQPSSNLVIRCFGALGRLFFFPRFHLARIEIECFTAKLNCAAVTWPTCA